MSEIFFDTYALVEHFRGSRLMKKYLDKFECRTTRLNLMETFYILLRDTDDRQYASDCYDSLLDTLLEYDDFQVKQAMEFRRDMRRKKTKLSYIDAVGYVVAKASKLRFLTGDSDFKKLQNVEFIKS